jgi:poly(3-hydroxyalkanoate) synthetase
MDNERVRARVIGSGKLAPVEDAPGSYVRVKG